MVGIACTFHAVKLWITSRGRGEDRSVLSELQALREEVRQLRQQNNDVILNLDAGLDRIDRRVLHLERRSELHAGEASAEVRTLR